MLFPMIAGADNVATELLDMFGENELPLPSAMIQRRNQVRGGDNSYCDNHGSQFYWL